jgi:hypothetical protein
MLTTIYKELNMPVYDFTGMNIADSCYLPDGDSC